MIVAKQGGVRRRLLAVESVEGRAVHQVDVEPAIVVVVDQADARAVRLHDELLLRHAHLVDPAGEACGLGDVLKDHRALIDESTGSDRPLLGVILWRRLHARRNAAADSRLLWWRRGGLRVRAAADDHSRNYTTKNQTAKTQKARPPDRLQCTASGSCLSNAKRSERSPPRQLCATSIQCCACAVR